jgi:hypothetical protein
LFLLLQEQDELDMDEEEEEGDRRSRSTASRRAAAGSKAAHTNSTAAYSGGAMPSYMAYSNEQGYWGSGYMDGTTSGVSTAAADGAPSGQPDVAQGVVGHGQQHVAALDMSCVHPGALDPSWTTTYQQAAAAGCAAPVTTHGPIVHSSSQPMLAQGTHSDQQQQDQQYGGDVLGGTAGLAGNNNIQLWQQQQQQGHHKQQPQQQQDPLHAPPFGGPATAAAADCTSLSSLFQVPPAPQLEGSLGGYEVEAPCVSPRVKQEPGAVQSAAAGAEVQANINCLAAHVRPQAGTTPPPQGPGEQLEVPQGDQGLEAPAAADPQLQQPAAAQAQVQPWDAAKQQQQQEQYMTAQHQAKMQQGYVWPAAAPAFGGFAPHCTSALPHPQQHQQHQYLCFQQGMHSWWQQHSDCQPQQQPETAAGNGPQMNAVVVNMSAGHLDSLHAAPPAAADAPALAAQAAALQPSTGLTAVCVSHTGQHTHQQVPAALVAPAADPAAAPSAAGGRQAALTTVKLEGGMTSSMLAAAPAPAATLPGCPGHSTVDSILRQLEAGVRSPPGSGVQAAQAGMHGGASVQAYPRMSLSALLEPSGGLHQSLGCGRRLSQVGLHT